jgi:hypothetical protein
MFHRARWRGARIDPRIRHQGTPCTEQFLRSSRIEL